MLIAKVYINDNKIDDIHIWNTGEITGVHNNIWKYKILKPEGFEDWNLHHKRDKGYIPLLKMALEIIEKHGDKND